MATENVDEFIKDLKKLNGFAAYAIMNNDGSGYAHKYIHTYMRIHI